jgi:hypothetical protein
VYLLPSFYFRLAPYFLSSFDIPRLLASLVTEFLRRCCLGEDLGLFRDQAEAYSDRLQLWNDFNICWLSLCQKQKDLTSQPPTDAEAAASTQPGSEPTVMTASMMEDLGEQLIRLCDKLEPHGLVDYQMGIWEEEILSGKLDLATVPDRIR